VKNGQMKQFNILKLIQMDLYRYHGSISIKLFLNSYFLIPGFNYMVWFRITEKTNNSILKYILYRKSIKFGIQIPVGTDIGKGFYIGHFGNIVINGQTVIGENCNISQGVTIGQSSRGKNKGYPTIGNNCYIGPGAKIIGNVTIGNNVAIGANAVVTKNVEDTAVVVGIPIKVISYNGSEGYIVNKVEEMV
jgi:serine O-acetyltransferase